MDADVLVVGAGLFGSMATHLLRKAGARVLLIDDQRPFSGSAAAGCLLRPTWLSSLNATGKLGLELLNEHWPPTPLNFRVLPTRRTIEILHLSPSTVLLPPDISQRVLEVLPGGMIYLAEEDEPLKAANVLVAAGAWTDTLVPVPPLRTKVGVSFIFPTQLEEPLVRFWAPYKQLLAFNNSAETVWAQDGTAILYRNWGKKDYARIARARCAELVGRPCTEHIHVGHRPFVEGHPRGFLEEVLPRVWASTGGGKFGAVLGAYQAQRFLEAVR